MGSFPRIDCYRSDWPVGDLRAVFLVDVIHHRRLRVRSRCANLFGTWVRHNRTIPVHGRSGRRTRRDASKLPAKLRKACAGCGAEPCMSTGTRRRCVAGFRHYRWVWHAHGGWCGDVSRRNQIYRRNLWAGGISAAPTGGFERKHRIFHYEWRDYNSVRCF